MKLPHRAISASGSRRCRAAGVLARRMGASYPSRPVRISSALPPAAYGRYSRATDRPMAVGAARSAIRHREPARCGGNIATEAVVRAPPDGYTLLLVGCATRSTQRSTTSSASISSATSRRSRASSAAQRHGGESIGPGEDGSRVHRLRQGQSRQDQHGSAGNGPCPMWRANCSR